MPQLLHLRGCKAWLRCQGHAMLLLLACTTRTPSRLQANITVGNCVLMLEQADHYKMQKLGEVGSFTVTAFVMLNAMHDSTKAPLPGILQYRQPTCWQASHCCV